MTTKTGAGEAMPTETFTDLLAKYQAAELASNISVDSETDGTRKAFEAMLDEVSTSEIIASDLQEAIAAIRQAFAEEEGQQSLTEAFLLAAIGYFDKMKAEQPWARARILSKELSETLALCNGGTWAARIMPDGGREPVIGFAATNQDGEHPLQIIDRLSGQICEALDGYLNGHFHVRIFPDRDGGHTFYFANTSSHERERV